MIRRLRLRFIRFATLAATAVLLVLGLILNLANYISVNNELNQMLNAICENQGRAPSAPPDARPGGERGGQFTVETPYTTRYFVLRYTENGELDRAELGNIASVTEEDVETYLQIARQHGVGRGYTRGFKYLVVSTGGSRRMAVFLDCYDKTRSLTGIALLTVAAIAAEAGVTPDYLSRQFRTITGVGVQEYLRRCRFARAADMLVSGASVSDTAKSVGFASLSHFSREFKKELGVAPSGYARVNDEKRE